MHIHGEGLARLNSGYVFTHISDHVKFSSVGPCDLVQVNSNEHTSSM